VTSSDAIEQVLLIEASHLDEPLDGGPGSAKREAAAGRARDGDQVPV
jgi:hypothetical protein